MMAALGVWTLAMASGLTLASRWTFLFTALTVVTFLATQFPGLSDEGAWMQLAFLGITPWLLAAQRFRDEGWVKTQQADEAKQLTGLSESSRKLLTLQNKTQEIEKQIAEITDAYHVTRETSKALRLYELFDVLVDMAARLLNVAGLTLVDLSADRLHVLRAGRLPDGRIAVAQNPNEMGTSSSNVVLSTLEQAIVKQARSLRQTEEESFGVMQEGETSLNWVALWWNHQLSGVLIVEDLAKVQRKMLSMIANQVSLQLSRIYLYQQVEGLAITDALTGLYVRRYFLERAQEELARAKRHGLPSTLLIADLDRFKGKNDTYGHLVGDIVLKEVARLLQQNLREVDLVARYGGEEFIFLLIETSVEQAMLIAQRLRQLVELHPIRAYDELLSQTISIGIAGFPEDADILEDLIRQADTALYAAKSAGRNRVMRAAVAK